MEPTSKGRALRLEVDEADKRVWFRLYSHDAAEVRSELDPGTIVYIRARVREYLRKGGFREELDSDSAARARGEMYGMRPLDDKLSLELPSLELFLSPLDLVEKPIEAANSLSRLRLVGLDESVRDALNWLRQGLDSSGSGYEDIHEAEEILSKLLGDPIWTRPE